MGVVLPWMMCGSSWYSSGSIHTLAYTTHYLVDLIGRLLSLNILKLQSGLAKCMMYVHKCKNVSVCLCDRCNNVCA